jgi:O-antigen/teichoic acid export membrane protein
MESIKIRKLASNFSFLSGGEAISKICTFAAFAHLARVLGPENFGYLEFTLAIMVFFTLFVDFGSSPYGAREIAKDKTQVGILSANIVVLRILLAITAYSLLFALVFFMPGKDSQVRRLILIYGLTLFGIPVFLQWVFQGFDKMKWVALGSIIRQLIFASGVFLLIRHADRLWLVAVIECMAVAGFVIYNLYTFRSRIGQFHHQISPGSLRSFLLQMMPIGLSELAWASTWYAATILLGLMVGGNAVGWFSAAHRPIMTLHTFVWLYFFNLLPSMSRCSKQSKENLQSLVNSSVRITAWFAVFLGTAGTLLADPLINLVYGAEYAQTVATLKVLIWVLPIALLSGHYRYALIACDRQRDEFISSLWAAAISVLLGFVLIPKFAALGAAWAVVAAAAVNFIVAYKFVREKIVHITFWNHFSRPMFAAGAMIAGFLLLQSLNRWLAIACSVMLFIAALIFLQPEVKKMLA